MCHLKKKNQNYFIPQPKNVAEEVAYHGKECVIVVIIIITNTHQAFHLQSALYAPESPSFSPSIHLSAQRTVMDL